MQSIVSALDIDQRPAARRGIRVEYRIDFAMGRPREGKQLKPGCAAVLRRVCRSAVLRGIIKQGGKRRAKKR